MVLRWTGIPRTLWATSMTTIRCTATWSMCIRIRGWRSTLRTFSGIIFIGRLIWQSVCRWSRFSCLSRSSWWLRRGNWWRRRCCSSCQWCNTSWNRSSCCLRWSRIWRWITWTLDCWWQWCQRLIANVFLNLQKQKPINLLSIYQIRNFDCASFYNVYNLRSFWHVWELCCPCCPSHFPAYMVGILLFPLKHIYFLHAM